jgi:hypothetical protein
MKFNTNLSQVKVFARFCLSKQTLHSGQPNHCLHRKYLAVLPSNLDKVSWNAICLSSIS